MADKKIIAVLGATGSQGGGLVRAILADPNGGFAARALTRDPNSDKAKELAKLGAEVVAADVDDVESLKKAFAGAYGAYCVTFFWNHFSPEKEIANATNMAEAAEGRRRQARDLVDAGRHAQVGAAERQSHAHAARQIQVPALRRQGRSRRAVHQARPAGDLPADDVLLGQRHLLRHGSEARSGRQAGDHVSDGRQEDGRHCRGRYRQVSLTASSRTAASGSARPSASPASTLPARRWPRRTARRWVKTCATTP